MQTTIDNDCIVYLHVEGDGTITVQSYEEQDILTFLSSELRRAGYPHVSKLRRAWYHPGSQRRKAM